MKPLKACIAATVLLMLLPGLHHPAYSQKKSILDYYRMLKPEYCHNVKFDFFQRNGLWKTRSYVTEQEIDPIVDLKNGYISVADPGTGGGTLFQEAALFIARDGAIVIGVNKRLFNGVGFEYDIRFYRYDGQEFVTDKRAWSAPPVSLYFAPGTDLSAAKNLLMIGYELPRYGTTVRASIDMMRLGRLESADDVPAGERKKYADIAKNKIYDTIEFEWDINSGTFVRGKKIKGTPRRR